MRCGAGLPVAPTSTSVERPVERKVITALFCDLVGSTELAERLDPEDVDRLLRSYHALARARIESHGGVVEKFIGDAVVGVFGAPAAHEDDAIRAVRAALGIVGDVAGSGLDLQVRIGVHTGEALVRVGDDRTPEEGFATGDCLNTAARLQNVAPVGGVAVGDPAYRLAMHRFAWEDLGPVELKGKAQPVRVWRPLYERVDDAAAEAEATPFVGRDDELERLVGAVERSAASRAVQLVSVIAEPGMGKSRLIREVARRVTTGASAVTWRRGRCLPYGDGISFWALGEIVKSHAQVLDTDDQATIGRRLDAVLTEPDLALRAWMRDRLAPLVGLRTDAAPPPQEEAFAAWRRFLLSLAEPAPVVLVIEDLHWADDAMIDFLHDLLERGGDVPLLIIITARPEISERHPTWLARADAASVLQLVSLGDAAVRSLVESTLAGAPESLVRLVLDRAGGSPLYAEQLAALVRERGLSAEDATLDATVIPPTIQALLAARIDALPAHLKPALLDASVVGRTFWSGAIARLSRGERDAVERALADLSRRELTRAIEPSTMTGEAEYGFWHALLRDVAYAFLPRAARLARHRAAAAWITEQAGDHLDDLAEIVADHLHHALELAEATGATDEVPAIRADLADALIVAAGHAMRVLPARAVTQLGQALELMPADDPRRAAALAATGRARLARGEYPEAVSALDAAAAAYEALGDAVAAAALAVGRFIALTNTAANEAGLAVLDAAQATLEAHPGPELVELLAHRALLESNTGQPGTALAAADGVLALAERLGFPPPFRALYARGNARLAGGDREGEGEYRRGVELAREAGDLRACVMGLSNLANNLMDVATPTEALATYDEGLALARDHGLDDHGLRASRLDALDLAGRWDDVLADAPVIRAEAVERGDAWTAFMAGMAVSAVLVARGERIADRSQLIGDPSAVGLPATVGAHVPAEAAFGAGDLAEARRLVDHVATTAEPGMVFGALELVWVARRLGDLDLARRVLARAVPEGPTSRGVLTTLARAILAEAEGDPAGARDRYSAASDFFLARGWAFPSAFALMGAGRTNLALGERVAGLAHLERARAMADDLNARPLLAEISAAISSASAAPPIGEMRTEPAPPA